MWGKKTAEKISEEDKLLERTWQYILLGLTHQAILSEYNICLN
jgi:hypothetical protein